MYHLTFDLTAQVAPNRLKGEPMLKAKTVKRLANGKTLIVLKIKKAFSQSDHQAYVHNILKDFDNERKKAYCVIFFTQRPSQRQESRVRLPTNLRED